MVRHIRTAVVQILFARFAVLFDPPRRLFTRRGLRIWFFPGRARAALGAAPGVGETSWVAGMARTVRTVRDEPAEIAPCAVGRPALAGRGALGACGAIRLRIPSLKVARRTVPAFIGIRVPDLARVLSRRTNIASRFVGDAFRRRIPPGRAALARRMIVCPDSTAELTFGAQYALSLVGVGVLARAARSAICAGGSAHLSSAAVNADPRADVS